MLADDIREEVQAEMKRLLHQDERSPKLLNSKTLRAPISQIEMKPLVTVAPHDTLDVAIEQMVEHRTGCVLVVEGDTLKGIFTERDILTKVVAAELTPADVEVEDVMTSDPETLTSDAMLAFALNLMHIGGYRHVPIVNEDGVPTGILSVRDVLHYLAEFFPEEVLTLPPKPDAVPGLYGG